MAPIGFEPEDLTAPLSDQALASLDGLLLLPDFERSAREMLKKAAEYLTDMTGELNDRAYDHSVRHSKDKARRRTPHPTEDGVEENPEEDPAAAAADARYKEFQHNVEMLTKRMDLSIRGIIDDITFLDEFPATLKTVVEKAHQTTEDYERNVQERTAAAEGERNGARPRRLVGGDGDVDMDDDLDVDADGNEDQNQHEEEEQDGDEDNNNEQSGASSRWRNQRRQRRSIIKPADMPHIHLSAELARRARAWSSKTPTEKYTRNNNYRQWYRVLYDAKNPGDTAPPMPDESLWFAAEEGRADLSSASQRRHHRHRSRPTGGAETTSATGSVSASAPPSEAESGSDNELEIAAEKTRLRCPLTLRLYVDPVTSKNCNHSYERTAILDMLQKSTAHVPFTPEQEAELARLGERQRRRREREMLVRQVTCPECSEPLVEADLLDNPALKRRVARRIAQERRDQIATSDVEVDSDDDDETDRRRRRNNAMARGTERQPLGLGSSSPPLVPTSVRKAERPIKVERAAAPGEATQDAEVVDVDMIPQTPLAVESSPRAGRASRRAARVADNAVPQQQQQQGDQSTHAQTSSEAAARAPTRQLRSRGERGMRITDVMNE